MPKKEITRERIIEELETVMDPELGLDLWTLGLIYKIDMKSQKEVLITMTYTTPLCPFGAMLTREVEDAMYGLNFDKVLVEVTFDPPWKAPENLREMLGV